MGDRAMMARHSASGPRQAPSVLHRHRTASERDREGKISPDVLSLLNRIARGEKAKISRLLRRAIPANGRFPLYWLLGLF